MGTESSDYALLQTAVNHYGAARFDQAEGVARRLMKRPEVGMEALLLLCKILTETGRWAQALYELERVVKQHPNDVQVLMSLYNAYVAGRQPDRGLEAAKRAYEASGHSDDNAVAIAALLQAEGKLGEAEEWFRRAHATNPDNGKAILGLARVLSQTLRGAEGVALLRATLASGMRGLGLYRYLTFHLRYASGVDPKETFELQKLTGTLAMRECDGFPPRLTVDANPDKRLTIGYISPDFRQHACAHFMEPLFTARDRNAFKVIAYSASIFKDAVTERFKKSADSWVEVATMRDAVLAHKIAADGVDIIFDLAGHTSGTKVQCLILRPAPITATYIGYPATTGAPGVDYRFVDSITDPPGAEALATEKLVRIDPCFLCYRPMSDAPPVAPPPFEKSGHITFGSFNAVDKISEATLDTWCEVLKRVPGSKMVLKGGALQEPSVAARVKEAFAKRGIEGDRVEPIGKTKGLVEHMNAYGKVDIALDTFPYNGTTTTCEALWMGVPVVAFKGLEHSGRVGASLLNVVGLGDLVGEDQAGMVETAVRLAGERERLSLLRPRLREQMAASPLCDEKSFVKRFETAVRGLWRDWCAAQKAK